MRAETLLPPDVTGRLGLTHTRTHNSDYVLHEVSKERSYPPVYFMDLRPLEYPMLVVANHEVAEQISKASTRWPSSTPKSPTLKDVWHLTGRNSMLTDEVSACFASLSPSIRLST